MAKYLPELGWESIIITPSTEKNFRGKFSSALGFIKKGIKVVETDSPERFVFLKKILGLKGGRNFRQEISQKYGMASKLSEYFFNLIGAIVNYPDADKTWKPAALEAAKDIIKKHRIDVVLSSSSPVISHLVAHEIKQKYHIPWVADLRDLWSQNHNYYYGPVRCFIDRCLERRTLGLADALITVSEPWAAKLNELHRVKRVYSITNGFDPDRLKRKMSPLTKAFTITYTGNLYKGKQDLEQFFIGLSHLINNGKMDKEKVRVRVYGPVEIWIEELIMRYRLNDVVKQYGIISREDVLLRQNESQLLLLVCWKGRKEKGCYPLKTFEYLSVRRPIFAVGGEGGDVIEKLLDKTKSGFYCRDVEEIKIRLMELYHQYLQHGKVRYQGKTDQINAYNYCEMTRQFVIVFDQGGYTHNGNDTKH
ncbi:MAG: glycosyltransferase [bacterium]|nr:glycosyltransferase [bacterium]